MNNLIFLRRNYGVCGMDAAETKHARFGLFKQSFVNTKYTESKIKTSRFASVARRDGVLGEEIFTLRHGRRRD